MSLLNENGINSSPIICHVDMDAYEWQVVCKEHPEYIGHPGIVVNPPGRIVAVSYEAKIGFEITRKLKVNEAKARCRNLIVHVKKMEYGKPESRALRKYSYDIKTSIMNYLKNNSVGPVTVDYASNDEFFLDVTKEVNKRIVEKADDVMSDIKKIPERFNVCLEGRRQKFKKQAITYRIGQVHTKAEQKEYEDEVRLLHGAIFVSKIIEEIHRVTGFTCSVGVSQNMLLAKLACGLNKPSTITILPAAGIRRVSRKIPVSSIPGLGGGPKGFGYQLVDIFNIRTMYGLQQVTAGYLNKHFRFENCMKLISWGNGISHDVVQQRTMKLTLSCGKTRAHIHNFEELLNWFGPNYLGGELCERLQEEEVRNKRRPAKLSIIIDKSTIETIDLSANPVKPENIVDLIQNVLRDYSYQFPVRGELKLYVPAFKPLQ